MDARSRRNLAGVHPDLVAVIERVFAALEHREDRLGAVVTEGVRTLARQQQLVLAGASRTMNSRHITGHAVDLAATVAGTVRWDWPLYVRLAEAVRAQQFGVLMVWGGSWKTFPDGPHFELDRRAYPAD